MAGIGFKLRNIMSKGTYTSLITAYIYGAVISTGPWLISIISIGILSSLCTGFLKMHESVLFRTILVYTYMGTLVFTGPFYMSTTRYLADKMYVSDFSAVLPTFKYVARQCLIYATVLSGAFYFLGGLKTELALAAVMLFQSVALTWVAMIFLSAARDYASIVKVFAAGYIIAVVAAFLGAAYYGLVGMSWGFGMGLLLLAVLLSSRVYQEFPSQVRTDRGVIGHWKGLPWLMLCGFAYNASLWVDKVIYWIAGGEKAAPGPFYAPVDYDTCFFWAYLTIVPAMTLFLIRIETSFYKYYAEYLGAVSGGATMEDIEQRRKDITANLWLSISRLLKVQGGLTGLLLLLAPDILELLSMPPYLVVTLRFTLIAAFIQALFLIMIIVILYFDWRKLAGGLCLLVLVLNTVFSYYFAFYNQIYNGIGALAAFLIGLLVGMYMFNKKMDNLIFDTFMSQSFET